MNLLDYLAQHQQYMLFARCLTLLALAILFLQSGIDKITDYKGNLDWLKGHFEKSPLKNMVPFMLTTITILEVVSGGISLIAIPSLLFGWSFAIARLAVLLCMTSLICLFFGQRVAKDYPGAASLIGYMAFTAIGFMLML